jgi:hypothetical protein
MAARGEDGGQRNFGRLCNQWAVPAINDQSGEVVLGNQVTRIAYEIVPATGRRTLLLRPQFLTGHHGGFEWQFDVGESEFLLVLTPMSGFLKPEDAQEASKPLLEAFVAHWTLETGVLLEYQHRETLVDGTATRTCVVSASAMLAVQHEDELTTPPAWISQRPLPRTVQEMLVQWDLYLVRRAGLLDRAYFCLSYLEAAYGQKPYPPPVPAPPGCSRKPTGGRRSAARALNVRVDVLCKLGDLTAAQDPRFWRKATVEEGREFPTAEPETLAAAEIKWVQAMVPRLIRRAWEVEAGMQHLQPLTINDVK